MGCSRLLYRIIDRKYSHEVYHHHYKRDQVLKMTLE